jgi:hypothetical protein
MSEIVCPKCHAKNNICHIFLTMTVEHLLVLNVKQNFFYGGVAVELGHNPNCGIYSSDEDIDENIQSLQQ